MLQTWSQVSQPQQHNGQWNHCSTAALSCDNVRYNLLPLAFMKFYKLILFGIALLLVGLLLADVYFYEVLQASGNLVLRLWSSFRLRILMFPSSVIAFTISLAH